MLGAPGQGGAVFQHSMGWERACLFAGYVGLLDRLGERCVEHARSRRQFGAAIGEFQAVAHRIVEMKLRLESARLLLYRACWEMDAGRFSATDIALSKLAVSEAAVANALDAVRLFGGRGYLREDGIETILRDSVPATIFSGTSDIQRLVIAKELGLIRPHRYVIDSAARAPHSPAVVGPDGTLTYGLLDDLAGRYAAALRANGVGVGDRVVVWSGKSVHAVAVMQAALRTGAIHVPVTSANPVARVARIARDCRRGAALVVLEPALADGAEAVRDEAGVPAISTDALLDQARGTILVAAHENEPDELAYILYTSGSTGSRGGLHQPSQRGSRSWSGPRARSAV